MQSLAKNRKALIGITAAGAMLLLAALAIGLAGQGQPTARAHEDGTVHIHPTPTPPMPAPAIPGTTATPLPVPAATATPPPVPTTPLPLLGLNGPLTLETGMTYQQGQHRLAVAAVVKNPPPEGWHFSYADVGVEVEYEGWSFSTYASRDDDDQRMSLQDGVLTANLTLPEYIDLNQLTQPMIAQVNVSVHYYNDRGQRDLGLYEVMYVDLRDRGNWRE